MGHLQLDDPRCGHGSGDRQFASSADAELAVDGSEMGVHRPDADVQLSGDVVVGQPGSRCACDLAFASRQAERIEHAWLPRCPGESGRLRSALIQQAQSRSLLPWCRDVRPPHPLRPPPASRSDRDIVYSVEQGIDHCGPCRRRSNDGWPAISSPLNTSPARPWGCPQQ